MTTNALTAADCVVLQQYANAGKRELYWQYLELKGDVYAQRAGEVVFATLGLGGVQMGISATDKLNDTAGNGHLKLVA